MLETHNYASVLQKAASGGVSQPRRGLHLKNLGQYIDGLGRRCCMIGRSETPKRPGMGAIKGSFLDHDAAAPGPYNRDHGIATCLAGCI